MDCSDNRPEEPRRERGLTLARLKSLLYRNRRAVVVLVCLGAFLELLEIALAGSTGRLDTTAYLFFVEYLRRPWLTPVMESFSALATPVVLIVLLVLIEAFAPGRRPGLCCGVNLVLVALLNVGLKAIVARPRPEGFRLVAETGFSFPSGHSMAAMAFFGLIAWLVWRYEGNRARRAVLATVLAFVAVMVGISRIYLGVHYASDVLAGFCAALIWLALYTRVAVPFFLGESAGAGARVR